MVTLRPLHDKVLVKPDEPLTQIGLLEVVEHKKPDQSGTLMGIGPAAQNYEHVKVGDRVLFSWMAGQEVIEDATGERLLLMREEDLLAVVEE